jgi:hypothetical protein
LRLGQYSQQVAESARGARQAARRRPDRDVAGLQDRAAGFGGGGQQRVVLSGPQ